MEGRRLPEDQVLERTSNRFAAAALMPRICLCNRYTIRRHCQRGAHQRLRAGRDPDVPSGRSSRGGLVVSAASMKKFMEERGFFGPLHVTSAKTGAGCDQLREAIVQAIDWKSSIPETTSPALYHRLKQEILSLRDSGLVLIRLAELKQRMEMTLRGENFELAELEAVVSLLAGPGIRILAASSCCGRRCSVATLPPWCGRCGSICRICSCSHSPHPPFGHPLPRLWARDWLHPRG